MHLPFRSILTVCTGNICRSPLAEARLRQRLAEAGADVHVASAGVGALVDEPADPHAVTVAAELGMDLSTHRGQQLTLSLGEAYELILVMENGQKEWIVSRYPVLQGRVYRLGHWQDLDIPDPYGRSLQRFRAAASQIDLAVDHWLERIAS